MAKRIAIVGAGILGLTLALRYAKNGKSVTVFESASSIGGLAGTWQLGEYFWDKHYHVTLYSDIFTRQLIEEIGLSDQLEWVHTRTGFYTEGRLESLSDLFEFLSFSPIGLIDKFRLGTAIFIASRIRDWKRLERIKVEDWLTKISGRSVFEKIWKPLLKSKLGESYKETSAAFIWATIRRMYAARSAGMKKEQFGYVKGGYATVLAKMAELLGSLGVTFHLNAQISRVRPVESGRACITVRRADRAIDVANVAAFGPAVTTVLLGAQKQAGKEIEETFDAVILTCPSPVAAKLIDGLPPDQQQKLSAVRYQGIVCASALIRHPLSSFYVTNLLDEMPFTAVIEMTALVDPETFGGNALIYLPKYAAPDDPIFLKSDGEIEEEFLAALQQMYPTFTYDDVLAFKISRVKYVFPLPVINYSESIAGPETSLRNIYVVNSSQIINGTLNVNETVQLAESFFKTFDL
jgi:protoporphyrinogen oxidase